jgi:NAD(P)-dependent dehydrogenase (short-subunit alcohol dehydrogenase family)
VGYFDGKKVLVTGGSSGIGRAAALQLARQGASVAVLARRQGPLDETVSAMQAVAVRADQAFLAVSVDVTDAAAVDGVRGLVLDTLGGLDALINNSGYARPGRFTEMEASAVSAMMDVNYMGHVNVTRAFARHFQAQKSGDICMVTSMLGFMGFYGFSGYAASKFAIVGFAECLRQEMMADGVRVTLFYPPTTDTPGLEAENEVKPAETWAIEGMSKAFSADDVATAILDGVQRGRFVNLVGAENWMIYYAYRLFPGVVRWVIDRELSKHVAKNSPARS